MSLRAAGRCGPASPIPERQAVAHRLSCIEDCGAGFDFYQLFLVAEHGDAHQGAGDVVVAKRVPDYFPRGHPILSPCRGHQGSGAEDVSSDAPASARAIRMFSTAFAAWPE